MPVKVHSPVLRDAADFLARHGYPKSEVIRVDAEGEVDEILFVWEGIARIGLANRWKNAKGHAKESLDVLSDKKWRVR